MVEILKIDWICEILSKLWNLIEILKFCQNCEIWSKLWNLVNILKFLSLGKFGIVGRGYVLNVGRDYVINVGRGYVNQHHEWMNDWQTDRQGRA